MLKQRTYLLIIKLPQYNRKINSKFYFCRKSALDYVCEKFIVYCPGFVEIRSARGILYNSYDQLYDSGTVLILMIDIWVKTNIL